MIGAASPLAVVTAAVASVAARAAAAGSLPGGVVVLGDEGLPTAELVRGVQAAGISLHRFVGAASRTSW